MDGLRQAEAMVSVMLSIADEWRGAMLTEANQRRLTEAMYAYRATTTYHFSDREETLLPRLRRVKDPRARLLLDQIDLFHEQHRTADDHADAATALMLRWIRRGTLAAGDARGLREHLVALTRLLRRELTFVEQRVVPAAVRILPHGDLSAAAAEMQTRRARNRHGSQLSVSRTSPPESRQRVGWYPEWP